MARRARAKKAGQRESQSRPKTGARSAEPVGSSASPGLLDVGEAAELVKVSKPTFYRWLSQGTVPGFKVGGQWRFRRDELQRFMESQGATVVEAPAEIDGEIEAMLKQAGPAVAKADREAWRKREADRPEGEAKVVRLVDLIVKAAVARGASDIHLDPTASALVMRYRVDGVLQVVREMPRTLQRPIISRFKMMADLNMAERRAAQDGGIHLRHENKDYYLRVGIVPALFGESLAVRVLDRTVGPMPIERQGFTAENRERIEAAVRRPVGLIIFAGPTGCGKTTTALSWLGAILTPERKTLTVEDPAMHTLPWATQMSVNRKVGLTLEAGLQAAMRQDPDIIFAGAIDDLVAAQIVLEAAMTGHLAITTLYANTAPGAVTRLLEMGCEPFVVGEAVTCVVAQRLIRVNCTKCAAPYSLPDETLAELRARAAAGGYVLPEKGVKFMRGKGCDHCKRTGYRGRVALFQVMPVDWDLAAMIAARRPEQEIRQAALDGGMKTLFADGFRKAAEGLTTAEEVLRVTYGSAEEAVAPSAQGPAHAPAA